MHSLDHMRMSEAYWRVGGLVGELNGARQSAIEFLEAGDAESALQILLTLISAMAKLEACAAWQSAAITAAQVFCWERRKGLNKDPRTGYLRSGFMALSPVKVMASTPKLLPQAMNPSLFLP